MKIIKCEICGKEFRNLSTHLPRKHNISPNEYKQLYNKPIAVFDDDERKQNSLRQKEIWKNLDLRRRVSDTVKKSGTVWNVNYWINRGYNLDDAEKKVSEYQSHNAKLRNDNIKPEWSILNSEYWKKNGMTDIDAENEISKIQSIRSRKSKKFAGHNHTDESKKNISINMSKYIKEFGNNLWIKHFKLGFISKTQEKIYEYIKANINFNIESNVSIDKYVVDFKYKNKIIEFYGDFWHLNPEIYDRKFINPVTKEIAYERWKRDDIRKNNLIVGGYDILIVWERDYNKKYDSTIELIRNFLNDT